MDKGFSEGITRIALVILVFLVLAWTLMVAWNVLAPVFGWPVLAYAQACAIGWLFVLVTIPIRAGVRELAKAIRGEDE